MIQKNMGRKYMVLMVGLMLIVMVSLFLILGENVSGSMVTGYMIVFMGVMLGAYLLAMFLLMRSGKGHRNHKMDCIKCEKEISPGNLVCPNCGHENRMEDLHGNLMNN